MVGGMDGFVNNAGVGNKIPINFIKRVTLQNILDVNTIAPILLSRYLLKKKKRNR
jgi:short-subunit dehydrogenase